jgi:hypothetical protein
MSKIPTAEEFLNTFNRKVNDTLEQGVQEAMIEFAKLHVKEALETASKKAKTKDEWEGNTGSEYCDTVVDRESIINAYPLDNIK